MVRNFTYNLISKQRIVHEFTVCKINIDADHDFGGTNGFISEKRPNRK